MASPSLQDEKLLICFYGDDFTGSTDSMEALSINGVKTVLFLKIPDQSLLESMFPNIQAFGVAGIGRTLTPEEMEDEIKPKLEKLKSFRPNIIHYKMCSTFDSSPEIGSIGKIIDIGLKVFSKQKVIPMLIGAPVLKRYTVFGNHFATVGEKTFRLDRHPTMSQHPITPMNDGDLRVHLQKQTTEKISHIDILMLEKNMENLQTNYKKMVGESTGTLLFDVLTDSHIERIGELLWTYPQGDQSQFIIGSSGVEYALCSHWLNQGIVHPPEKSDLQTNPVDKLLVVSGSCSPVTAEQINWALSRGFVGVKIPTIDLLHPKSHDKVFDSLYDEALNLLEQGESVIIYTALGPKDPSIQETKEFLQSIEGGPVNTGKLMGQLMGELTKKLLIKTNLQRVVISGGDTSGYATQMLGIYGLEMIIPIAPGGPLCRCYSEDPRFDGLEISLKGGQVGKADYFGIVKNGSEII